MRSVKLIRYGRRATLTNGELTPTMTNSFSFTSLIRRQSSMSSSPNDQYQDVQPSNDDEALFRHRKNKLAPNVDSSSRRSSFQQQDLAEAPKTQINLRNFYIFFLLLFLFLFMSLVYSFIRMIKNPD